MNKDELNELKNSLLSEKKTIEWELKRIAVPNPNVEGDWVAKVRKVDQGDSADEKAGAISSLERRRAIEQSLELKLKEIAEKLKEIEGGTYGKCSVCNSLIDYKRLQAVPATSTCIECGSKEVQEE